MEANQRIAWTQQNQDKRAAAEYLVEQTRLAAEERQFLISENESLHYKLQEINFELERV